MTAGGTVAFTFSGYLHEMTIEGTGSSQQYTVTLHLSDGTDRTLNAVFNSQWGEDTIPVHADITGAVLSFPEDITITGITLHNGFVWNIYRMTVSGLLALCVYLLIALRRLLGAKPHWAFAIVALCVGFCLCAVVPAAMQISQDDQIHTYNISRLSFGAMGRDTEAADSMFQLYWNTKVDDGPGFRADTLRDVRAYYAALDSYNAVDADATELHWQYAWTGYVVPAAGMALTRTLGLPFHAQLAGARLATLLLYVVCVFAAIASIRRYRWLLCAIALNPAALFYACSLNYDGTAIALCFLGTALAVDAMLHRDQPLSCGRAAVMLLSLCLGASIKMVYMPLLFLTFMIPGRRFSSNWSALWFKVLAAIVCVAGIASMMISVTASGGALTDSRAADADSAAQIAFILGNPFTYLGYFFSWFFSRFLNYFVTDVRLDLYGLGYAGGVVGILSTVLTVAAILTAADHRECSPLKLNWARRLGILLCAGLASGLLMTTMYTGFAAVGSRNFSGMQARYFLPLLPACYMLLVPDRIHVLLDRMGDKRAGEISSLVIGLGFTAVLGAVLVTMVLNVWYL